MPSPIYGGSSGGNSEPTDATSALLVKPAVAVVAVANLTLSGEQTIDGVLTSGSLVLCTAQSTGSQNGPWVSASGAWARPGWYTSGSTTQAPQFLTTFARLGTTYSGSMWRMTTASVTIDTTSTTWAHTPISLESTNVTGTLAAASVTGTAAVLGANTFTGAQTNSTSGAASTPALKISGVPFAGTGTTSFPLLYVNDASATASTTLSTAGTYLGVNGDGTQDLINLLKDGTSQFKVSSTGVITGSSSGSLAVGGSQLDGSLVVSASGLIYWTGKAVTKSPVDGVVSIGKNISTNGGTLSYIPITPTQVAANTNDYNPGGPSMYQRWSTDASRNITGLVFTGAVQPGQTHIIVNVGAQNIVLINESASSTAANRFHNSTGADITLAADQEVNCWYDDTTARWRVTKRGF